MSVLIKGMDIPESCGKCDFNVSSLYCKRTRSEIDRDYEHRERLSDCPISAFPDKHGRLIDADALIKFVEDRYEITWESDCYEGGIKDACSDILEKIDTMPTVIEAEGE